MASINVKAVILFLFILPAISRAEDCFDHDLKCQHLANILITPKGIENLLKEKLAVNMDSLNLLAQAEIQNDLKNLPDIVLYEPKADCNKELSPDDYTKKLAGLTSDTCMYYPFFAKNSSEFEPTKYVPIRIKLKNFDVKETGFAVNKVACTSAQSCQAGISANKVKILTQFTIETLDGKPIEAPYIELNNKPEKAPATAQFNLNMTPSGKMISTIGTFDKFNLNLEEVSARHVVVDKNGKVLSPKEILNQQKQGAQERRQDVLSKNHGQKVSDELLKLDVTKLNEKRSINGQEEIPYDIFKNALIKWKDNKKNYDPVLNELPSLQSASVSAAVGVKGFSSPLTEKMFNNFLGSVNNSFHADPKFNSTIKNVLDQGLKKAETNINQSLAQISGDLGRAFVQTNKLPVADVANLVRLEKIETLLIENQQLLNSSELGKKEKEQAQKTLANLEQEKKILTEKLNNGKSLMLRTEPFIDQIDKMNRIGIFEGSKGCPPPTKNPETTDNQLKVQLHGADFGFEMPMANLQKYIDEMYKISPEVCLGSIKPGCQGGQIVQLNKSPKLIVKDGQYRLQMNDMNLKSNNRNLNFDVSVDLNIRECAANNKDVCLAFVKPSIDKKSTLVKTYDAFAWLTPVFSTSDQKLSKEVSQMSEINLSELLPPAVNSSFTILDPKITGPQGSLLFPMNLKPQEQRVILGKN